MEAGIDALGNLYSWPKTKLLANTDDAGKWQRRDNVDLLDSEGNNLMVGFTKVFFLKV